MMQSQPQVFLTDYFGGKSVVLRSIPEDFFKPYSGFLTQFSGKWNPNLKHPNDPSGATKLGGWIFPKKNEAQVQQAVQQIQTGQVPQQQPVYSTQSSLNQGQTQTLLTLGSQQQPQNTLQQLMLSAAQARNMGNQSPITSAVPIGPLPTSGPLTTISLDPSGGTPLPPLTSHLAPQIPSVPLGYQQVTYVVIKPEVGQTLQFGIAGQKIPAKVKSAETNNGIVNQAVIVLPDGQETIIRLTGDQWSIPTFLQPHTISLQ